MRLYLIILGAAIIRPMRALAGPLGCAGDQTPNIKFGAPRVSRLGDQGCRAYRRRCALGLRSGRNTGCDGLVRRRSAGSRLVLAADRPVTAGTWAVG
jgi:hypothetical protein